jgi:AbiTii
MARSQLLIDAVSGKEKIENLLLRLKVILSDLDNENIMNWVNGELEGYKIDGVTLPPYRIIKGNITGTYVVNFSTQYTNQPVPLQFLISPEKVNDLSTIKMTDGIGAIQNILEGEKRESYGKVIPTEYCHAISTDELQIAGMRVMIPSNRMDGIVSQVKTKLVDVIMELEKEFNNLDELDIRSQIEQSDSASHVINIIENIIYDESIKVGDKNKIKKSSFGHLLGLNKK